MLKYPVGAGGIRELSHSVGVINAGLYMTDLFLTCRFYSVRVTLGFKAALVVHH